MNLRTIFVFIFLAGMILTIFQYIPVSEEESGTMVELSKKAKEGSRTSDDVPDDDSGDGDDVADDYFIPQHLNWCNSAVANLSFSSNSSFYHPGEKSINTPPPKI